jgi:hypothetical protein
MRKIAFLLPILLLPLLVNAQKSPIDKLFDKYYGKDGFTTVLVTQDMFEVLSGTGEFDGEFEATFGKIKRVRVIAMDDDSEVKVEGVNFMEELKGADFDDYKELVVVKDSEQEVLVLAKDDNGKLTELLVVVGGEDNVLVSVEGKFTMEDLEALSDLEGLDSLKDVL